MKILQDIDEAITKLGAGKFTGNVLKLLTSAKAELEKKRAADATLDFNNVKDVFTQYRKFDSRLQEVCREMCLARYPYAKGINCDRWYLTNSGDCISAMVTYREYQDEDAEEPYDGVDGTGYAFNTRTVYLSLQAEWLWCDGWEVEAEKDRLETALRMTERNLIEEQARIVRDREALVQREQHLGEATSKIAELKTALAAYDVN